MATDHVVILLLDLALICVGSRLLGGLARRLNQPAVIGEIISGVLMGPTLLHGAVGDTLFPQEIRPHLAALASLGVVLFMFAVGFELDHRLLRGKRRAIAAVSIGSVVPTFALGVLVAWHLASGHPTGDRISSILFLGVAMSVTALPVLARILHDRGLNRTSVGSLAVSCAAVTDALAWMTLAVVTMLANRDSQQWRMAFIPVFVALLLAFRPLARRLMARTEHSGGSAWEPLAFVLPGLLLSAAWTEWMGLHYIIGAFLFGLLLPKDGLPRVRFEIEDAVHKMGTSLLLPVFFVIAGLKVDLSRIGAGELGDFALIMLVAVSSKFGGVFLAARAVGMDRTRAAALGTLMNTRGLTELVMLSAGLGLGLLDQELYSLMVLMAVFTTVLTGPLLRLLYPRHAIAAEVERSAPAESEAAPSRP